MPFRSARPPFTAHPRSRGENTAPPVGAGGLAGSSPLTRGKRDEGAPRGQSRGKHLKIERRHFVDRLIPAHAGKTCNAHQAHTRPRAHPRSRGENRRHRRKRRRSVGSSPLTRGKHGIMGPATINARLIPAHAGKTSDTMLSLASIMAHPRSRGENKNTMTTYSRKGGSSPLTRGKRSNAADRSTPAGAHPRSRGENGIEDATAKLRAGSSPLTRGKLMLV